jgi:hypothetical protein
MAFFSDLDQHLAVLRETLGSDVDACDLPAIIDALSDEAVLGVLAAASGLARAGEKVHIAAAGVAAARSRREAGHEGLAQKRGHRSTTALIQEITGATKAEAAKHVRLGESLRAATTTDTEPVATDDDSGGDMTDAEPTAGPGATSAPWHAPLGRALLEGVISSAQHDAILRGLGEPPAGAHAAAAESTCEAWSVAVVQLIAESAMRTVEELGRTARTVRDQLDPEGAQRRFDQRFEARSFRLWRDGDGVRRGSIVFDDFGGAWATTIVDSAMRPRRGGPRFVDDDEKARAAALVADPRSNDQLAYDLLMDVLRAGALADVKAVFGTRQAGVRVLATATSIDAIALGESAVGLTEDDQTALPGWLIGQLICDTGTVPCTTDPHGNPLDLGREARLFSPKQRIALAFRDGGCRWRGCDRPASYCEAHHLDAFADGGRTDIDRGILLCRWHHMELHHGGWRITRHGRGEFLLHPPEGRGDPIVLTARLALRYAWADTDPPPQRFQPAV